MKRTVATTLILALPLSALLWLSGAVPLHLAFGGVTLVTFFVTFSGFLALRVVAAPRSQGDGGARRLRAGDDDVVPRGRSGARGARARGRARCVGRLFHPRRHHFAVRRSAGCAWLGVSRRSAAAALPLRHVHASRGARRSSRPARPRTRHVLLAADGRADDVCRRLCARRGARRRNRRAGVGRRADTAPGCLRLWTAQRLSQLPLPR